MTPFYWETGVFWVALVCSVGNNYYMIAYHPDAHGILVETMKSRQEKIFVDSWHVLSNRFQRVGLQPSRWITDNK